MRCSVVVCTLAAASILCPVAAHAQKELFVAGIRDLGTAVAAGDPSRSKIIDAAVDRMAAALAEWDRRISAVDARVTREIEAGPRERAVQLHLELGITYLERGRAADAVSHLEAAAALDPASPDVPLLMALALEAAGRPDEAARHWQLVWKLDPGNPVKAYHFLQRAGASAAAADRERAVALLTQTYRRLLSSEDAARPLSFAALRLVPDTFSKVPIVGDAATAEGFAHLAAARYDEAIAALRRGPGGGDDPIARLARGRAHEEANRVGDARREYEAAVAGTLSGRSALYVGIGRLAQVEGDLAGAVEALGHAVRLNPDAPHIHHELALAYAAQGRVDEAFLAFVPALLLNPRDGHTFAAIGRLLLDAGRDADALPPLYRALTLAPDRHEIRYAIATGLTRLGRTAEAARELAAFERAQRDTLERQRRDIATQVQTTDPERQGLPGTAR